MGSGYIMYSAALDALKTLTQAEQKEALENLGSAFLISNFSSDAYEDFYTTSFKSAVLVAKGFKRTLIKRGFDSKQISIKICPVKLDTVEAFKVSFFK